MTPRSDTNPGRTGSAAWAGIFIAAVILISLLAITSRSFWIDETYSARLAQQPTPLAGWQLLRAVGGSDPQMPLYLVWLWTCEKLVGSSELALRAVNLLWFIPALLVLMRAAAGNRPLQLALLVAAGLNPFAWYYLNEARAYTMQFSTSLILYAALGHWCRNNRAPAAAERNWIFGFALALVLLCGSSILSMLLGVTPLVMTLVLLPRKKLLELGRKFRVLGAGTLLVLLLLGLYYLWTLHSGNRATDIATTSWQNLGFIGYELLGFAGLGPGRLEIRTGGLAVFKPYAAVLLAYAGVVAVLLGAAVLDLRRRFGPKKLFALLLAAVVPAGLILVAGAALHFRVLGRHLAALLPGAILLFSLGGLVLWRRGTWGKALVMVFLILYGTSALSLRFAARHEKDDYRDAAAVARTALAAGKTVWWNADANAAVYYQLPIARTGGAENGKALWLVHPPRAAIAVLTPPEVLIASRPDVYDEGGTVAAFLAAQHYQLASNLPAFGIWTRPVTSPAGSH